MFEIRVKEGREVVGCRLLLTEESAMATRKAREADKQLGQKGPILVLVPRGDG
jgi:hypothetical protein